MTITAPGAGDVVDDWFDDVTDAINELTAYGLGQMLDAVNVTKTTIASASFSSETNISQFQLTFPCRAGEMILFVGQTINAVSNTDSEFNLKLRRDTSVSGTIIGTARIGRRYNATGAGVGLNWIIPWVANNTSSAKNVYVSAQRATGTGNLTLEGGDQTFHAAIRIGRPTSTLRVVST